MNSRIIWTPSHSLPLFHRDPTEVNSTIHYVTNWLPWQCRRPYFLHIHLNIHESNTVSTFTHTYTHTMDIFMLTCTNTVQKCTVFTLHWYQCQLWLQYKNLQFLVFFYVQLPQCLIGIMYLFQRHHIVLHLLHAVPHNTNNNMVTTHCKSQPFPAKIIFWTVLLCLSHGMPETHTHTCSH